MGRIKDRLSTVHERSWHYRLVKLVFDNRTPKKACAYYWGGLPVAMIASVFIVIFVGLVSAFGVVAGFVPDFRPSEKAGNVFYPYKTLPSGKRYRVAPWEVLAVAGFGVLLGFLIAEHSAVLFWVLGVLAVLLIVGFLIFWSRGIIKATWDKVCPDLKVRS